MTTSGRALLLATAALPLATSSARDDEAARLLRTGGVVALFRHALAPGVYDPPGLRLDDCSTRRKSLASPRALADKDRAAQFPVLKAAIAAVPEGGFEVCVTL